MGQSSFEDYLTKGYFKRKEAKGTDAATGGFQINSSFIWKRATIKSCN